jgi:hypothetical protein
MDSIKEFNKLSDTEEKCSQHGYTYGFTNHMFDFVNWAEKFIPFYQSDNNFLNQNKSHIFNLEKTIYKASNVWFLYLFESYEHRQILRVHQYLNVTDILNSDHTFTNDYGFIYDDKNKFASQFKNMTQYQSRNILVLYDCIFDNDDDINNTKFTYDDYLTIFYSYYVVADAGTNLAMAYSHYVHSDQSKYQNISTIHLDEINYIYSQFTTQLINDASSQTSVIRHNLKKVKPSTKKSIEVVEKKTVLSKVAYRNYTNKINIHYLTVKEISGRCNRLFSEVNELKINSLNQKKRILDLEKEIEDFNAKKNKKTG